MIQILTTNSAGLNVTGTRYTYVDGSTAIESELTRRNVKVAEAGVFRDSYIALTTAPGVGKSYAFTLMKNNVATAHVVTIANTATSGSNTSNPISVAAGDRLAWRIVPTGTPTQPGNSRFVAVYECTTANRAIWGTSGFAGGDAGMSRTAINYTVIGACAEISSGTTWVTTEAQRACVWAIDATIKSLFVSVDVAPGTGKSWTFRIVKNGIEEASSQITIADSATAASVTGLNITIVSGDLLSLKSTPSGTPFQSNPAWGISYAPTTDGQWNVSAFTDGATANFMYVNNVISIAHDAVEANRTGLALGVGVGHEDMTIFGARMKLVTAPGIGHTREAHLLKNGSPTGISMTITGTDTTATDAGTVLFTAGDTWVWNQEQVNAPANSIMSLALLMGEAPLVQDAYAFIT